MNKLVSKYFSLVMLVIFMTNTAVWSFESNWLAHELEHNSNSAPLIAAEVQSPLGADVFLKNIDENTSSASEHQLIHAVDHLQLFPGMALFWIFPSLTNIVPPNFLPVHLTLAMLEAPFRPPRHISLS